MEKKIKKEKVKREPAKVVSNKAPDGIIFPRLCYDSEGRSKVMSKEEFEKSNYKIFNK
jgi:hypothetical protein